MAYTPPSTPLDCSWVGAPAATPARGRLLATWRVSLDQHIFQPIGAPAGQAGLPSLQWQQTVQPVGLAPEPLGAAWATYADAYVRPQYRLSASWYGANAYLPPFASVGVTWSTAFSHLDPAPITPPALPEPTITQQQMVRAAGFAAGAASSDHFALFPWQYAYPRWVINASWVGKDEYAAPASPLIAAWSLPVEAKQVSLAGWDASAFGLAALPVIRPAGFNALLLPWPTVSNLAAPVRPSGFSTAAYGSPVVWNWHQYIRGAGYIAQQFGSGYVQGGVKYLTPGGIASLAAGRPTVINTTADQSISLSSRGITPAGAGRPSVSPQTLRPEAIYATVIGVHRVQFPPRPAGWLSSAFGYPIVADKAKYVGLAGIPAPDAGFPVVRDRAFYVRHQASVVSAVFGDVQVRLVNQYVRPGGADSAEFSDWAEVRSMRRPVYPPGAIYTAFGGAVVANKTPALWPSAIDSMAFGAADVGFRFRQVAPSGVVAPYPQVMTPSLWQTPGIRPNGIAAPQLGIPTAWPSRRNTTADGWDSQLFGEASVGFSWRALVLEGAGIAGSDYGARAAVEHSVRGVSVASGRSFMVFGEGWVSRGQRHLAPDGVEPPFMSNHMAGTTRYVGAVGWESTRWLTRIIPENQLLEQIGRRFDEYGLARIENRSRSVFPGGITTYPEPSMHWGVARAWNLRQVISQHEDQQSGLVPPPWPIWTLIENRNKTVGPLGYAATRYGYTSVANNARVVQVAGMAAPALPDYQKTGSVTHRVRPLPLTGIEPPYLSGWAVVYNKAFPLRPPPFDAALFGQAAVENTRRYRKINGFESDIFGYPFVAFAIRELTFENRYGIQPPPIRLPDVRLHTRYVEAPSIDQSKVAQQSLVETRFNRIRPKWSHQHDLFGEAALRNRTPEYRLRGWDSQEWGDAHVRLQWRPVQLEGTSMQLFGRLVIADRTLTIQVPGFNGMAVSDKVSVRRIGAEPVATQYIDLRRLVVDDLTGEVKEADDGDGIRPPGLQVGAPNLLKGYIFHGRPVANLEMTLWGTPYVTANTIRVEPGYGDFLVGEPTVSLKNRSIGVPTLGQLVQDSVDWSSGNNMASWGKPRLSPHTIYAVLEAPAQAVRNHHIPNSNLLRPVNAGTRLGSPSVSQYGGHVSPAGIPGSASLDMTTWGAGRPVIYSTRQYVSPAGRLMQRFGWATIPGARRITLDDEDAVIGPASFGSPIVIRPAGPPTARPSGFSDFAMGGHLVELRHRTITAHGFLAQAMGSSRGMAGASMPQSLHVGPPHLHPVAGFDASGYGTAWVSHRVRELVTVGWDSFILDYDLQHFDQRMRVWRGTPTNIPAQRLYPFGMSGLGVSVASVRPGAHYIRPDGNSDQHRKGAPNA